MHLGIGLGLGIQLAFPVFRMGEKRRPKMKKSLIVGLALMVILMIIAFLSGVPGP
jgi:uncharacterized membrane protein SpoIIM required for sporulation